MVRDVARRYADQTERMAQQIEDDREAALQAAEERDRRRARDRVEREEKR